MAAVGSKTALIRKFQKVGDLLSEFAKASRRMKLKAREHKAKSRPADFKDLETTEALVKKTDARGAEDGTGPKTDQNKSPHPTSDEVKLAKSEGSTPEHISAREKVARSYLENNDFTENQIEDAIGNYRTGSKGGVDMMKPVEVISFPPPDSMSQHVRSHGYPGNWFDPIGNQPPDSLGISGEGRHIVQFKMPEGTGLKSTSRAIIDKWTNPQNPVSTNGDGIQVFVNDNTKLNATSL